MEGTFFFVHGTSVREKDYRKTWDTVQKKAQQAGITGVDFVGTEWGWNVGVPSERLVADLTHVLPPDVTARAVGGAPPTDAELEVALWAMLIDDPLFELRLAGQSEPASGDGIVVGGALPDQEAVDRLNGLRAVMPDLTGFGVTPNEVAQAAEAVAVAPELSAAALAVGIADAPALSPVIARAVVATVLAEHRDDAPGDAPAISMDGAARDQLVDLLSDALTPPASKGVIFNALKKKAIDFAAPRLMALAQKRRHGLSELGTAFFGDVFLYLRRGQEMADFVRRDLTGLKRPIVAVGHSLGGIILVDLLSRDDHPPVDLLVTAGSQSPVFYAMDALEVLRRGQGVPAPFQPWLNNYSRDDFISFCATRIFPGQPGIRDEEINAGVPFPESHGAYWQHDRVYELIRDAWPR
jgi:hypothetical protein